MCQARLVNRGTVPTLGAHHALAEGADGIPDAALAMLVVSRFHEEPRPSWLRHRLLAKTGLRGIDWSTAISLSSLA